MTAPTTAQVLDGLRRTDARDAADALDSALARHALPIPELTPEQIQRFWDKVDRADVGCWEWKAFRKPSGYGQFSAGTHRLAAHRVAYVLTHGEPPTGLDLDHLCRNRACVNPDHLEPVTRQVNLRRGIGHGSETHCPTGHEYVEGNIYRERDGSRKCATCVKARQRARYERRTRGART